MRADTQTCAICRSALVDPATTTSCKHTFCRDCITTALAHQPQCPIDRSALTTHNLHDTEKLVKLMLDELKVRCAAEGCGQVMERGLLLSHSKGCLKSLVLCHEPECGLSVSLGPSLSLLSHYRLILKDDARETAPPQGVRVFPAQNGMRKV